MARDPRIEQARERLRRLTDPSSPAGSRLERLRERARAARAARLGPPPIEWNADDDETTEDAVEGTEVQPAAERPVAVPFRPTLTRTPPSEGEGEEGGRSAPAKPAGTGGAKLDDVGRRLRALREHGGSGISDAGRKVGSSVAGAGHWVADRWHTLPSVGRARILAFTIVLAVVVLVWFVVVPAAPCSAPGGDQCPPSDDAIGLVPDDALAYVHLNVDPDTDQFDAASNIASRLPLLTQLAVADVSSLAGERLNFNADIRPWSGGEVALAVLPGTGSLERVLMIEADDEDGARDFASTLLGPTASTTKIAGTDVSTGAGNLSAAIDNGFLLVGDESALREMLDPPADAKTLEDADPAVFDRLPEDRLAYGYLSPDGAQALLAGSSLSSVDTFVDSAATSGVAAALSVDGDVATVSIRSDLDPERSQTSPGFFAALPQFTPGLTASVGSDALAYLGLGAPARSVDSLRAQAAADAPGLLDAFDGFQKDLRSEGGVSVTDDLLPLLGDEAALSVEPVTEGGASQSPGVLVDSRTPYVSLIADGVDTAKAAPVLQQLQQPLIGALDPASSQQVPAFEPSQIDGVEAQSLFVSPAVDLTYSTYDDRLVVGHQQARDRAGEGRRWRACRLAGIPGSDRAAAKSGLADRLPRSERAARARRAGRPRRGPRLRDAGAGFA